MTSELFLQAALAHTEHYMYTVSIRWCLWWLTPPGVSCMSRAQASGLISDSPSSGFGISLKRDAPLPSSSVQVCAMRLPVDVLLPWLGPMQEGMLLWAEDSKNKFKLKVRLILEKLVRRCGVEAVAAVTPAQDARLLVHIRKQAAAKERRRAASRSGSQVGTGVVARGRDGGRQGRRFALEKWFLLCDGAHNSCNTMCTCTALLLSPNCHCLQQLC
jgi:hypothetical protein